MIQLKELKLLRLPIMFFIVIVFMLLYYNSKEKYQTEPYNVVFKMEPNGNIKWTPQTDEGTDKLFKAKFDKDQDHTIAENLCEQSLNLPQNSSFNHLKFGSYDRNTSICRFSSQSLEDSACAT
jgi:hypothetical protein